jgi:hypothetical protein
MPTDTGNSSQASPRCARADGLLVAARWEREAGAGPGMRGNRCRLEEQTGCMRYEAEINVVEDERGQWPADASVPWSDGFRCPTSGGQGWVVGCPAELGCFLGWGSQRQEDGRRGLLFPRDGDLRIGAGGGIGWGAPRSSLRLGEHTTREEEGGERVEAQVPRPCLNKSGDWDHV